MNWPYCTVVGCEHNGGQKLPESDDYRVHVFLAATGNSGNAACDCHTEYELRSKSGGNFTVRYKFPCKTVPKESDVPPADIEAAIASIMERT